jgi:hypothetical protein
LVGSNPAFLLKTILNASKYKQKSKNYHDNSGALKRGVLIFMKEILGTGSYNTGQFKGPNKTG